MLLWMLYFIFNYNSTLHSLRAIKSNIQFPNSLIRFSDNEWIHFWIFNEVKLSTQCRLWCLIRLHSMLQFVRYIYKSLIYNLEKMFYVQVTIEDITNAIWQNFSVGQLSFQRGKTQSSLELSRTSNELVLFLNILVFLYIVKLLKSYMKREIF